MASSKGGCLLFDPHWIDLPSIPVLVVFYHACLGFPVKDLWLKAIKAGNFDTFARLTYLNVACYCPIADETILGHLAQMLQNVQVSKPTKLTPRSSLPPALKNPVPTGDPLQEVFLRVYPTSKLYTDDTGRFTARACLGNQYVMIAYHMDGNLILQQAFQIKEDKHCILAFNTIMAWLAACGLFLSQYQR
jgi:hypothetical protein